MKFKVFIASIAIVVGIGMTGSYAHADLTFEPMQPMTFEPMQPMTFEPMQPMTFEPMQPMTFEPMQPMTFEPMQPMTFDTSVNSVSAKDKTISGHTKANAIVEIKINDTILAHGMADLNGNFIISVNLQSGMNITVFCYVENIFSSQTSVFVN